MRYVIHPAWREPSRFQRATPFFSARSADGEVVIHLGNHLGVFQADDR